MGVLRADGVLLAADRALTNPAEQVAPGAPHQWHGRTKLGRTPTGVAIGLAGSVGAGHTSPAADLLTAALHHARTARTASSAATAVRRLFDVVADEIRRSAAIATRGVPETAHTIALVAGPAAAAPELFAVALPATGPSFEWQVRSPGTSFAPTLGATAELGKAVQAAALTPLPESRTLLDGAIGVVAVEHYTDVSSDWDHIHVGRPGAGPIEPHEERVTLPRGV